jgi:hypothetical protein
MEEPRECVASRCAYDSGVSACILGSCCPLISATPGRSLPFVFRAFFALGTSYSIDSGMGVIQAGKGLRCARAGLSSRSSRSLSCLSISASARDIGHGTVSAMDVEHENG